MKKLFTVILIISTLYSCSSGSKEFLKLSSENDGKMFTVEFMDKLISEFGTPVDTTIKGDYENNGWSYALFLGPDFDAEKGKELFYMAKKENDSLSKWFYKHMQETGDQQGLNGDQRYSDLNSEYANSKKIFIDDFDKKWMTIYFDKGGREKLKFSELIFAYQNKFPNLNLDQCIDSLKKLPVNFNTPEDFNIRDTVFAFRIDKSVSYKKALGDERYNKGDDIKDFNIWTNSTITKLSNGKVQQSLGTTYGLTEDSKSMLENIVICEWIYRDNSKEIVAKLNYFKNGTYTYSTTMFGGMNKRGNWRINFDGEIESTNQDGNMKITNTGIRIGSTIYKKN
jgi:hypothetical protein